MKKAYVYLANGSFFECESFGADGTLCGELVFNTSLSGYQEISTDPSYAGQFVALSLNEIGIVGANDKDCESARAWCKGILCRNYNESFSNFRAQESFGEFLKKQGVLGLCLLPIRQIVKTLRTQGAMMMVASTEISDPKELKNILESSPNISEIDYIKEVSTPAPYTHSAGKFDFSSWDYSKPKTSRKIVAIDFGIKRSILNQLVSAGFGVEVIPHNFKADELISRYKSGEICGVFLSNGPGDPQVLSEEIAEIKKLIAAKMPIFAICLGHQLLSLAHNFKTFKLKFGHHGGNHPVKNLQNGMVEITAQNHNYSVPDEIEQIAEITHRNLFDGTIEGLRYKNEPICSFQHHPEAGPGPLESTALFAEFNKILDEV